MFLALFFPLCLQFILSFPLDFFLSFGAWLGGVRLRNPVCLFCPQGPVYSHSAVVLEESDHCYVVKDISMWTPNPFLFITLGGIVTSPG